MMKLKVLALITPEGESWYHRLGNILNKREIELICLTEVPETINLLKEEKFNLALVDSDTQDLENTCFRISWLCRIPLVVITDDSQNDWSSLRSIGINNVLSRTSSEEKIVTTIEGLGYSAHLYFPRIKILIIEDDGFIRDAIKICFRIYWPEAEFNMASTGREGVDISRQKNLDLILLDLGLPDMSGYDVLNDIRSFSQIPIVMLTANRDGERVVQAIQSGANDYLVKPFKQIELMPRIRKVSIKPPLKKYLLDNM